MIEEVEVDFQTEFSRKVFGAFWLTYERLESVPPFFYQLNYYFEGLLYDFVKSPHEFNTPIPKKNLFVGRNFQNEVFLCHFTLSKNTSPVQDAKDILKSVNQFRENRKEILILNGTRDKYLGQFKSKYKDYIFKEIFLN